MMILSPTFLLVLLMLEMTPTEQKLLFSKSVITNGVSNFRSVYMLSLHDCRTKCMARPSCASVNYFRSAQKCELNKIAAGVWHLNERGGGVFSEKSDWTDNQFDNCICAHGESCVITSDGHSCVVEECDRLPTQSSSDVTTVGAKMDVSVQCLQDTQDLDIFGAGGRPNTTRANLTCSPDGTWKMKTPSGGECLTIVFVMVPGTGKDPYYEWMRGTSSSSEVTWNQFYRDGVIDKWPMLPISHIRFSIFKNLKEVKYVVFNGIGSTSLDWFTQSRVIESSWKDLSSASYNSFSVRGVPNFHRRFYINKSYAGCLYDKGWFVVPMINTCAPWGRADKYPIFVYVKSDAAGILHTESEKADYVYILLSFQL